jgi:hypothetical protein
LAYCMPLSAYDSSHSGLSVLLNLPLLRLDIFAHASHSKELQLIYG